MPDRGIEGPHKRGLDLLAMLAIGIVGPVLIQSLIESFDHPRSPTIHISLVYIVIVHIEDQVIRT
jgi:uncharacterized protein YhhL (DUF1145 family)